MVDSERKDILYKELSYEVWGAAIEVRKNFGSGHKESLYHDAYEQELIARKIPYEREKSIRIYHPKTGNPLKSSYRPDFVIDGKILVEMKALPNVPKRLVDQLYDYLRNSEYELGYFINFGAAKMKPTRIIYTNDRKSWRQK